MTISQEWWKSKDPFPLQDLQFTDLPSSVLASSKIPNIDEIFRRLIAPKLPNGISPEFVTKSPMGFTLLQQVVRDRAVEVLTAIRDASRDGTLEALETVQEPQQVASGIALDAPRRSTMASEGISEGLSKSLLDIFGEGKEELYNTLADALLLLADKPVDKSLAITMLRAFWRSSLAEFERNADIIFPLLAQHLWHRGLLRERLPPHTVPPSSPVATDTPATAAPREEHVEHGFDTREVRSDVVAAYAAAEAARKGIKPLFQPEAREVPAVEGDRKKKSDRFPAAPGSTADTLSRLDAAIGQFRQSSTVNNLKDVGIDPAIVPDFDAEPDQKK